MQTHQTTPTTFPGSLGWMITPQTIGVLLVSLYVVHWFIYPEALNYLLQSEVPTAGIRLYELDMYRDFALLASLLSEKRQAYAALDAGLVLLRAVLLTALLYTVLIYLSRVSDKQWPLRLAKVPVIALGIKIPQVLLYATIILLYPKVASPVIAINASLQTIVYIAYTLPVVVLAIGFVQYLLTQTNNR